MDTSTLEHETLGIKHKNYNELLGKILKGDKTIDLEDLNFEKRDRDNLLMIDVACEKKNLEYVLNVLKSEDMLYISRVLQKCTWLFTDDQYNHIINTKYLYEELFPVMTTKAGKKLLKCTRLHLNDETRAEQFYLYEKSNKEALKWLPSCSITFIEEKVKIHADELEPKILKSLCEKSITVFDILAKHSLHQQFPKHTMFLLTTHTEKYLDVIEQIQYNYYTRFNAKATAFLMKKVPERIIKNFEKYVQFIHIATFAKHMRKENIKSFLLEQANKDLSDVKNYELRKFLKSPEIGHLIEGIPRNERFDFVKSVFIDEIEKKGSAKPLDSIKECMKKLLLAVQLEKHQWYKFAPFHIAFYEVTKMIKVETSHNKKYSMLYTLICCAGKNEEDLQTLLQYYTKNHLNEHYELKSKFVDDLIKQSQVYRCNQKSWEIINEIFKNMDVYVDKYNYVQNCIITIILHNTLYNEDVPEIITKKFQFDTLKYYCNKLNIEEQEKVFIYLYNYLLTYIQNPSITTETELKETIKTLQNMLKLLKDWKKELIAYPYVLKTIKDIAKIKQENSWTTNLSTLYNFNKSWRKHMFEESLVLYPSQEVCVNALKHDPGLILRNKEKVKELCSDDKISMTLLHSKLRIHWPESLAVDWVNAYQERLGVLGGHKALIRGLCSLVPEKKIINIFKDYAPKDAKINWEEINALTLSLQRHIAKNMHFTRPLIDPNAVLWYAKGDYLQYALPSLLAVFYDIKTEFSEELILKLLDAPVSVQKHGIRFAILKLKPAKFLTVFLQIWNTTKNTSIRGELFKQTFKLLCKSKEDSKVEEVWTLLQVFIDNLTHTDEPKIFDMLVRIKELPSTIRPLYFIKCYNTYKRLLHHFKADRVNRYENYMRTLTEYSREIMESMDDEFFGQIIIDYLNKELLNFEGKLAHEVSNYDNMVKVVSAYLLCTRGAEHQKQRYQAILEPPMKRLFKMETAISRESNNMKNFAALLLRFYKDLNEYVMGKNVIIPYKMFFYIQKELELLPVPENYTIITMWKLTTAFTKLLSKNDTTCKWEEITVRLAPEFANICSSYLKEEVTTRFSCIYIIFSRVLNMILNEMPIQATCKIYKIMLNDEKFIPAFLAVIAMLPIDQYMNDYDKKKYQKIHKLILRQTLPEIHLHYYCRFQKYVTDC